MLNLKSWLDAGHKRIVFIGDSISQIGTYIAYLDAYLWRNYPQSDIELIDLGVSSETASGLSEPDHPYPRPCVHNRLTKLLGESRPDAAVICYGINDGIYHPFSEVRFAAFKNGMLALIEKVKKTGAKTIVMTPPPFDAKAYTQKLLPEGCPKYAFFEAYEKYDDVMRKYSEWVLSLDGYVDATVDIHRAISEYNEEKRRIDPKFVSGDGIHPKEGGHWIIAASLLKVMFGIEETTVPDFVVNPENVPFFAPVLEHHLIMSTAWREYVGHDNPVKDNAMPLDEAKKYGMELKNKALMLLGKAES